MTNGLVFAIYMTLAIITSVLILVALMQNKSQRVIRDFVVLCALVLGWQIIEILYVRTTDAFWLIWLFDLKLPFVTFASVFLLRFIFRFFRMEPFLNKGLFAVASVVPAITSILAVTSPWHDLIRRRLKVISTSPVNLMLNERGIWFWVHTVYSYLLLVLVAATVLTNHRKLPRAYRLPSSMMVTGVLTTIVSNMLVVVVLGTLPVDFTLVGMTVALVLVYIAISLSEQADFLMLARTEIFNYLDDHVFILNNDHTVIDANLSAREWMRQIGVQGELGSLSFAQITSRLTAAGVADAEDAPDGGEAPYLAEPGGQVVYRMRERAVTDRTGQQIGRFATLTDVTRYKRLIDDLEKTAGVDPLTGLGNRHSYLIERRRLDRPENLPLSIMLGDLNGLKVVNDTLGHDQGDKLLWVAASLLLQGCPSRARVFRIGGDEYVVLLPHTGREEAEAIVERVLEHFRDKKDLPFQPSIALGCATKERGEQDYDEMLREADRRMYASKRADRRKGPRDRRVQNLPLPPGMVDRRRGPPDRRQLPDRRMGRPGQWDDKAPGPDDTGL